MILLLRVSYRGFQGGSGWCRVPQTFRRRVEVALDGELRELAAPLEYRFAPAALRIVTSDAVLTRA
ncbi:MAG: hypothetical protein ACXWWN_07870 [Gemmatimonadales bacterium]